MCGIVGIANRRDAVQYSYKGLFALQHRGQESAGIAVADGSRLGIRVGMGLVTEVFTEEVLSSLRGCTAIGHVRYATTGASSLSNAQPLVFNNLHGSIAIAHNGNLTNAWVLRKRLESRGSIFQSSTDSEVIVHLIARSPGPVEEAIVRSLRQVEGAYALLFLTPNKMIAVRDPLGFRPLLLGRLGKSPVFASETTALHLMGAKVVREVEPGEVIVVEGGRLRSLRPFRVPARLARCVFEQVYFARPDSTQFGANVQSARIAMGRELAREAPQLTADVVIPVPDSGMSAALGFSRASGIPLGMGFMRSHYVGRTFIQPAKALRDNGVLFKLSPVEEAVRGRRIVLIDDSIVRGTTSRKICRMLRRHGVRKIFLAVSSPPILSSCYYGIDTPKEDELIASTHSIEAIRSYLGVDSLHYLSLEGLLRAVRPENGCGAEGFCTACFTKEYPTPLADLCAKKRDPKRR